MNVKSLISALAALFVLAVLSTSCKKTIVNNYYCDCDTTIVDSKPPSCTAKGYWDAYYITESGSSQTTVGESSFIGNGIAKLNNSPYAGTIFSGYTLYVPECRNVSADSLKWEVRLKNPSAEGAMYGYDVAIVIKGVNDTAIAYYVGVSAGQSYNYMGFFKSTNQVKNIPELVQTFTDWSTLSLETKDGVLNTYKNGVLIMSYNLGTKKLGRLKEVHVGFKGTGSLDWGKGYNQAGTVIFREEFNNGNQSNIEWF